MSRAGASLALSGGPLLGGVLIATLGWRAIFFINVPVAAVGVYLTQRFADETTRSTDRGIDVPGQFAAVIALAACRAFGSASDARGQSSGSSRNNRRTSSGSTNPSPFTGTNVTGHPISAKRCAENSTAWCSMVVVIT